MTRSVDELYSGFVETLPAGLRPLADDLPRVLGLAPTTGIRWSEVFSHEVTLEAPALIAEAFAGLAPALVREAVLAHALSVIEAFGTDRILDGQIEGSRELHSLLEHLRESRCGLLDRVYPGTGALSRGADRETRDAIREEQALLCEFGAATFGEYRRISLGKQALGFPASIALAQAAGATESQLEGIRSALAGVWLGLQFNDDAVDWEEDWRRGHGAWAVSLARRRLEAVKEQRSEERPTEPDLIRRRVFSMRVLYLMLKAARRNYRAAQRYGGVLGTRRLSSWCGERIARLDQLLPLEQQHPGYVVRATKLSAWAAMVLS